MVAYKDQTEKELVLDAIINVEGILKNIRKTNDYMIDYSKQIKNALFTLEILEAKIPPEIGITAVTHDISRIAVDMNSIINNEIYKDREKLKSYMDILSNNFRSSLISDNSELVINESIDELVDSIIEELLEDKLLESDNNINVIKSKMARMVKTCITLINERSKYIIKE